MITPRKRPPQAFIVGGLKRSADEIAQEYRRRFGIESSYRQLRQCLSRSTTRDLCSKLLQVGIALLLRNVWVCLNAARAAVFSPPTSQQKHRHFRFSLLLRWLDTIDAHTRLKRDLAFAPSLPTTT